MKFDRLVEHMADTDVQAVLAIVIRDHMNCECVPHLNAEGYRDVEVTAEHLAEECVDALKYDPSMDDVNDYVLKQGRYAL